MASSQTATARANPNIAFIKYWGNLDDRLHLPANSSLSMNMDGLYTQTTVTWDTNLRADQLILNGEPESGRAYNRVVAHLDDLRQRVSISGYAQVESFNNFPMGAGIASSAASFAALTLAATMAVGAQVSERELSTLARLGSGSASRSIPSGFVEWHMGNTHEESFAESIAPPDHWELVDLVAIVSKEHKAVVSQHGHQTATTSDLQVARLTGATERLEICKRAILERDFHAFAEVAEHDSNLMHAVMMTSRPPLFYWLPETLTLMHWVRRWRSEGLSVCYTLDAGPNVHCICIKSDVDTINQRLKTLPQVLEVRVAPVGAGATLVGST